MVESGEETREHLLAIAEANGYEVSKPQLARWQQKGLLPSPDQRGLGRGRGTETVYPSGTREQLLALCEIHAGERRLLHVGWRLWCGGYEVRSEAVREFLSGIAETLDEQLEAAVDSDVGHVSDAKWYELVESTRDARLGKPLGQVRRRIGQDRMPSLVSVLIEISVGIYQAHQVNVEGSTQDESDSKLAAKGLALDHSSSVSGSGSEGALDEGLEEAFEASSALFREHSLSAALAAATDAQLAKSRDQVLSTLISLQLISSLAEQIPDSRAAGMKGMGEALQEVGTVDQGLMVLFWTMQHLWGPPEVSQALDSYHEEVQQTLDQLSALSLGLQSEE